MPVEYHCILENKNIERINPIDLGYEDCEPGHYFGPYVREHWLIHYVVSGKGKFVKGKHKYNISQGECFVIRPYETTFYQADEQEPWEYVWIGFTCDSEVPKLIEDNDVFYAAEYAKIFERLFMCRGLLHKEEYLSGCLWEFFLIMSSDDTRKSSESLSAKVKNYIETEYMKSITINEIADRLHINRCYMSTSFKNTFGVSPQEYLNKYRLNKSVYLMEHLGYSPTMAAQATGYSDIFIFSRMFKRRFGLSPANYLKEGKAKNNMNP